MGIDNLALDISKLCDDPQAEEVNRFVEVWKPRVRQIHLIGISKVPGNSYMSADGRIRKVKGSGPPKEWKYCGQGQRLLILWNGDFAFCCSDINNALKLGNIREHSIRQVWNSPEISDIRRKIARADYRDFPACGQCPHSRG